MAAARELDAGALLLEGVHIGSTQGGGKGRQGGW